MPSLRMARGDGDNEEEGVKKRSRVEEQNGDENEEFVCNECQKY